MSLNSCPNVLQLKVPPMSSPWNGVGVDPSAPSPRIDPITLHYRARRLQSQTMALALVGLVRFIRRLVRGAAAPSPTTWAAH
ncbi:MAG: hypothetical protein K9H25_09045 [Rhodospirillum sp.]|nr:hypothetical protein [Rhodospirillum sp.]MCF8489377.1 hypothetical protein [Rhodospirillum sp.]MCF8501723.1 hypothetical protein [Rhodospirillum sp.]